MDFDDKTDVESKVEHLEPETAKTIDYASREDHQETVLQALKHHPRTVFWCVFALWVLLASSFDNSAGGSVIGIPEFRKDFGSSFNGNYVLPASWQAAYSGGPTASAIAGALGASYIADKIGRKLTYLIAFVFILVGITLETISVTNPVFFAGKFINGFAVGAFGTVTVTYVGEITPLALRGILTAAIGVSFTIGPLIAHIIVNSTGDVPTRWAYRAIFLAQYGITVVGLILLPFMPESPWWLLTRGRDEKAARSLKRLGLNPQEVETRMVFMKRTLEEVREETNGVTFIECFRKSNLRRTIISITPLSIQSMCGILFVALYFTYYIQLAGVSTSNSFKLSIGLTCCSISGNICSWALVDRVGRRSLSICGLSILAVLLCVIGGLAISSSPGCIQGIIVLFMVYAFTYNITIGATAYNILTETATARLRAKTASIGFALQSAFYTMWAFVLPYIFNPDQANLGAKTAFIFAGLSILCVVYLWWYQPETSGRSYDELDRMFIEHIPARAFKRGERVKTVARDDGVSTSGTEQA